MKENNTIKIENLENEVMNRVYSFEKKRTTKTIVIYGILISLGFISIIFLTITIYSVLKQQQTLDLLLLFGEDSSIIKMYFWQTMTTFWEESPQESIVLLAGIVVMAGIVIFFFAKNFGKIKRRFFAVKSYFKKGT